MIRFAIIASLVVAAAGCGQKDITADIEGLADRACACKDAACGDKVVDDLVALAKDNKSAGGDEARAQAAAQKLGQCAITAGVDPKTLVAKMRSLME